MFHKQGGAGRWPANWQAISLPHHVMPLLAILASGTICAGVNEWTNVGPERGGAQSLAIDPQNPNTVYAATSVGVFKSTDGGASWSNAGLNGFFVGGLIIDPQTHTTLSAWTPGSSDGDIVTTSLFKTTDGGATWSKTDSAFPANCCFDILFDPQGSGTMYALAGSPMRDLFKSTDGGASWEPESGLPNKLYFAALTTDPQKPSTLYAGAMGADSAGHSVVTVFKSTDGGAIWNEANAGLPGGGIGDDSFAFGSAFAIDPKSPSTVYVSRLNSGVYKSTNGGASWRPANSGMPMNNPGDFRSCCVTGVMIDPQNPNTLYVSSRNGVIFKSTNGGATWNAVSSVLPSPFLLQLGPGYKVLAIDPQRTGTLYAATQNGVSKSTDGGASWRAASSGLRAAPVSSVAINPQISSFIYAGNLLTTDAGKSWFALSSGLPFGVVLAIDPLTPGTVYAGRTTDGDSCSGSIFKSLDGGQSWMDTRGGAGCLSAMVIDPQSPSTVYAGSSYRGIVYKTADGGTSWSAMNTGLSGGPSGVYVSTLAIDPQDTSTVYAGGSGGVSKSTDGGTSWNAANSGLTTPVSALAIDPQDTRTVYAATPSGLFKSTDGGTTWRNVFPSSQTYVVAINPQNPSMIYAGADSGVVHSADGGESWTPIPSGPGRVRLLALDPQDPNTLYAGGPGGLFAISFDPSR
jgi:photosystem II stability/assembly factor-like uncharacterized protein